jgi:hypothetical protein
VSRITHHIFQSRLFRHVGQIETAVGLPFLRPSISYPGREQGRVRRHTTHVAFWLISVGRTILDMSRTHPEYFDPETADRLVVTDSLVGGDPEEEDDDEKDDVEEKEEEEEGYSE